VYSVVLWRYYLVLKIDLAEKAKIPQRVIKLMEEEEGERRKKAKKKRKRRRRNKRKK